MIPAMIEGATRVVGKSQGYIGLPIRDEQRDAVSEGEIAIVNTMTTAWEPTPDELAAIAAGAKIEITIMGNAHPPINVGVGPVPE